MTKFYLLEFAVESSTELKAMNRLKALGIPKADEAKLSDLDRQAGLFIIRVSACEAELSDEVYSKILAAKDVFILSDELSAKRAQKVINLTSPVEQQLKKLLICVLPETEKVLNDIIESHQKHRSNIQPTSRIEWSRKIGNFSFGEMPGVLEEDISKLAKEQLLSSEGLLSLITSAVDFDALKDEIAELSKPKTVWGSISTLLERPVEYGHISGALKRLCVARNDAAHLGTITNKRLAQVKKDQKHIMQYIGEIKSDYQKDLKVSMRTLSKMMSQVMESVARVDPAIFDEHRSQMSQILSPLASTLSKLQLDIASPSFASVVQQNAPHQTQIAKGLSDSISNMTRLYPDEYQDTIRQLTSSGVPESILEYTKEMNKMRIELGDFANEKSESQGDPSSDGVEKSDTASEGSRRNIDAQDEEKND